MKSNNGLAQTTSWRLPVYLMYVDESGDIGMSLVKGSSRYFVLSGLVVHEGYWNTVNREIALLREDLAKSYGFDSKAELHAFDMLGRARGKKHGMSRLSTLMMMKRILRFEAEIEHIRIINVVIDKQNKPTTYDPFTVAWERLINRFEATLSHKNFPSPWTPKPDHEKGFLVVDETDENKLRNLIRTMRFHHDVPSAYIYGETVDARVHCIVEDPMHKKSYLSQLIQLADVNAYFLKQYIDPSSTIIKYKARNYFRYLEPVLLKQACKTNELGIVYT